MQHSSDICVVGNGAIGKTAALAFAQAGLSVTLVAPPAPPMSAPAGWDVRVYALNHIAHDLLSGLRVWDALDATRIAPVDAMDVRGDAPEPGRLGFDAYGARSAALAWIVEDANLGQALDAALRFAPGVKTVQAGTIKLEEGSDAVVLTLANGDTVKSDLIVGADGAQSWVRGQCDIGISYRAYGQTAVVTNFSCAKPHRGVAHQWFSVEDGIVALLPLAGERVSLVWSAPEPLAQQLMAGSLDAMAERLGKYAQEPLGALTPLEPRDVKAFPLRLLRTESLVAPRVALVGDAAHVVHPLAGHGMNLGFADVAGLVEAIRQREDGRDCGDSRVLARYARARKEDILLMQVATDGLQRLFSVEAEPLRLLRNAGMTLLDKLPFVKRRLISHAMGRRN